MTIFPKGSPRPHRRCSGKCKDWKLVKGGAMVGNGKGRARRFVCAACKPL